MIPMKKLIFLLLLCSSKVFTQSDLLSETISEINFTDDTVKSVFLWITDNISYDIRKLKSIEDGSISKKASQFKSEDAYKAHLLENVIEKKKGVCEDYAMLFKTILDDLGYESHVILGYTKQDGKVNRRLGHAWNAVKVGDQWKLFDPTWAAGSAKNGERFIKKYNDKWYDVSPSEMIKTHMPFDPMWQMLSSPKTYASFNLNGSTVLQDDYPYLENIEAFTSQDKKAQMEGQLSRSQSLGGAITLVEKWRKRMKNKAGFYALDSQKEVIEGAIQDSKNAVDLFNKYIDAKNARFRGDKHSLDKAEDKLLSAQDYLHSSLKVLKALEIDDRKVRNNFRKGIQSSEVLLVKIREELQYIEEWK